MNSRTPHLHPKRIETLRDRGSSGGSFVLYWMQGAQRVADNHALEFAVSSANELGLPLQVVFCLTDNYPEANQRHYRFMLEGLQDVAAGLRDRSIGFRCLRGNPPQLVTEAARDAALLVTDRAYLRVPRQWRAQVADSVSCTVVSVDTNLIVPVQVASQKREYAARTIRPRLRALFAEYCRPLVQIEPRNDGRSLELPGDRRAVSLQDIAALLDTLDVDRSISAVSSYFHGGEREALRRFRVFLSNAFFGYANFRNEPKQQSISTMSPYLHFGHVSPLRLALEVLQVEQTDRPAGAQLNLDDAIGGETEPDDGMRENKRTYLEELCVRRELAHNYVEYETHYDRYEALPQWARKTLAQHRDDPRPAVYDLQTLAAAKTDDPYWNAAMTEMTRTGFMHNYMRMYWGKQIISWIKEPEEAFAAITQLNNRYFLDGRDPNSYANIGWIFGLHDRPWPERAVFGTVRTMNANGLKRKCDIDGYVQWVNQL